MKELGGQTQCKWKSFRSWEHKECKTPAGVWGFEASLGEAFLRFAQVRKGRGTHRLPTKPAVPELLSRNHRRDGGLLESLSFFTLAEESSMG